MPLRDLWPPWKDAWVLHHDADLVVVDKPAGPPTHAPSPDRVDDVHTRLRQWLRERNDAEAYVGIHQRLDADTSGVLLFTRRKEVNAAIAEQFEKRRVEKTYTAVVTGWRERRNEGVLRHRLAPAPGGVMRAVSARAKGGQEAVTRYRIVRRSGDRTLLELAPETGRTHQIRVQLAAIGAPIVGDTLYGGLAAHRLFLHASSLTLVHPSSRRRVRFESSLPRAWGAVLDARDGASSLGSAEELTAAMREAAERRYGIATLPETDAFRIVNGGGDGLAGVTIDVYRDHLVVALLGEEAERARDRILDAAHALGGAGVYVKVRPKHASTIDDARRDELAPRHAVRGEDAPDAFTIRELGLPYEVRLGEGLSTGIFLDQRDNRRRVREMASGLRVLNLFAYTGAFTVAAVAGSARESLTIDVAKSALAWAQKNLASVGADPAHHRLVEADALRWLAAASHGSDKFDLVLLDPPSFATTKTSRFAAEGDYRRVAALALRMLAPGGRLLACTNHRGIVQAKFRRYLHEAGRDAARTIRQMKDLPAPSDFPAEPGSEPHLKSILVTLV